MASVDWCKTTTQQAGAMKKHNGKDERVNGNHSNPHIDPTKSYLNVYIGADDYAPMLAKVKARIKAVDREHPPLRNMGNRRITCMLLETPVPQEIADQGRAAEFLRSAHKVFEDFFGAENVGGTCGHFDEQHWYTDKDGKERLSLIHGHTLVAAYAEWTDRKTGEHRIGINGKNCETKSRLKALNKAMDEMCQREYGISYNTAETPQRKSVERLKEETELRREADMQRKKIAELKRETSQANQELTKILNYLPKKSSENLSNKCEQILQDFNGIKSPIIPKSTAQEYINDVVKQAKTAIKQLDKVERTNYTIRQVNLDGQKTNAKLHEDNNQLRTENKELRRELSAAGQRDNAARRLGLADVISDEVERGLEKEKAQARQKEKKRSAEVEL